jgi:hypothetical protein
MTAVDVPYGVSRRNIGHGRPSAGLECLEHAFSLFPSPSPLAPMIWPDAPAIT